MNRYSAAFHQMKLALMPVAEEYNRPLWSLCLSALKCAIFYGVTPKQYVGFEFYKLNHRARRTFYTARHQEKWDRRFNEPELAEIFWDKAHFNAVFSSYIKRAWCDTRRASASEISAFLNTHDEVFVKPAQLSSGRGIHLWGEKDSVDEAKINGVLLEERVRQHPDLSVLNPSSVNSVRIYTALDRNQEPHILAASLRVGGPGAIVDNYHSGGVAYPIDVKTGAVCAAGTDTGGKRHLYHPGTNSKVIGFVIPNWEECKEFVFAATQVSPTARLIAWDVAVLQNGFEMIEANYDGDSGLMQTPKKQGKKFEIMRLLR